MTTHQWDMNMLDAITEFDALEIIDADALISVANKHNVNADDLLEAWIEE